MLLCWLALLLVRVCEVRCGQIWRQIHQEMDRLQRGEFDPKLEGGWGGVVDGMVGKRLVRSRDGAMSPVAHWRAGRSLRTTPSSTNRASDGLSVVAGCPSRPAITEQGRQPRRVRQGVASSRLLILGFPACETLGYLGMDLPTPELSFTLAAVTARPREKVPGGPEVMSAE